MICTVTPQPARCQIFVPDLTVYLTPRKPQNIFFLVKNAEKEGFEWKPFLTAQY